ncbi:MAG TPA: CsbD family protein [Gemmatimonadales bacterium]|nr:CsbD family protein [Gemmatimonadales bacterium]
MSDSRSDRIDELKTRLSEVIGERDGDVDLDAVVSRVRESVGKAGRDVDTDALIARVKDAAGTVEVKVDAGKIRQWVDDVDRATLQGRFDEAKSAAAGAAAFGGAQAERLSERAPGAMDKVIGAAKEALGDFLGNEELAREGELQHLKGGIEARYADAHGAPASPTAEASDAEDTSSEGEAGRG